MFSYKAIEDFFKEIKKISPVYSFPLIGNNTTGVILRHDIDVSVQKAYDLAMIEHDLGMVSTLFFLTTCPLYNVNTAINRKTIRSLSDKGFDIGLHFDPTCYNYNNADEMNAKVKLESSILEDITGVKVKSVSLHCPSIHGQYPKFEGYFNAYDARFFNPDLYLSDSRMTFRGKDPFAFIKLAKNNLVQIVLHPFHYSPEGGNYLSLFKELVKDNADVIDGNFRPYNNQYVEDLMGKSLADLFYKF